MINCNPPPNLDIFADKHQKTALTYAAEHNKEGAVKMLVENGASFYLKNKIGKTARDIVIEEKFCKSARIILKQERVNVVKGCVHSKLCQSFNVPDYIIAIISQFVAEVPQEIIQKEIEEEEAEKKKKKRAKAKGKARARGRGRGRGRRRGRRGRRGG